MTYVTQQQVLLCKIEGSYGADPTPTAAADGLLAIDPVVNVLAEVVERPIVSDTLGQVATRVGARYCEVSFSVELRGSGDSDKDVPPKGIGAALQACGFTEAINASTSVVYNPESATASLKSVTIWAYLAGRKQVINGCLGNVEIVAEAGKHALLNFTFQGIYVAPTDTAIVAPTYDTVVPPVVFSAAFELGAVTSLVLQQFQLNMQNEIARRDSVSAATSLAGFQLVRRNPIGSMNPEQVLLATWDPFAAMIAATEYALEITIGSAAGNKCTITAPKTVVRNSSTGDRNGLLIYDNELGFAENAGDDEVVLTFE